MLRRALDGCRTSYQYDTSGRVRTSRKERHYTCGHLLHKVVSRKGFQLRSTVP